MCHKSCASCLAEVFTGCLTCKGTTILFQSSCYCSYPWSGDCTGESQFQGIFRLFQSFYILAFILLIILYCLKIRLPLSYRVLSGLQFMSLLIYSPTIYLDYEDFFVLRFFNLLSGPFQIDYRLQTVSSAHAIQTYIMLGFFIFLLLMLFYPSQTFMKKQDSVWQYAKSSALQYLQNFYYFGGKMMFVFIGMVMIKGFQSLELIVHFALFSIIIAAAIVRLIMEYHKNSMSEQIFQAPLYIYCMLMNAASIGIPLIESGSMLLIIFLAPLGLLILIVILNKQTRICDKNNIKFCVIELVMAAINVGITLVDDNIRTFALLIVLVLCAAVFCVEMGLVYYGGVDYYASSNDPKANNNKIQPANNESLHQIQPIESKKSIELDNFPNQSKRKGKYF